MGTSTAGGYVTREGNITTWLNELAFVPIDYNPDAPIDEWSGDYGCGVQYFSQQAVARLIPKSGLEIDVALPPAQKLKLVQAAMAAGDARAARIYSTIGVYLGYTLAHFADFYDFSNVLLLGRVTTGEGGNLIVKNARNVLAREFPTLAERLHIHMPDEKERRHGQAIAAASLPAL
ncbi:MAG TPA: ROK family protein, partial [Methylomirabilota bacterium]|nr:ROK family protein [Methylomirabilota bacterium]